MALPALLICLISLSDPALAASSGVKGWREALAADAAAAAAADPALAAVIAQVEPVRTRTGVPRLIDARLDTPLATPLLLERALDERDPGLRRALVEAGARADGDWSAPVAGLLLEDADPAVRALAAELLDDADPSAAAASLPHGASDADPAVRAAAMRAIGGRPDGAAYAEALATGLVDPDAEVRQYAARSAGWLDLGQLYGQVAPLLSDTDADVRLSALHAAARLAPSRVVAEPALGRLLADPDPRVARAAAALQR